MQAEIRGWCGWPTGPQARHDAAHDGAGRHATGRPVASASSAGPRPSRSATGSRPPPSSSHRLAPGVVDEPEPRRRGIVEEDAVIWDSTSNLVSRRSASSAACGCRLADRGESVSVRPDLRRTSLTTTQVSGVATGWLPPRHLSAEGRRRRALLGERRRRQGYAVLVSAWRGHEDGGGGWAVTYPLSTDIRLRECDYGDLNGFIVAEVARVARPPGRCHSGGGQSFRVVEATQVAARRAPRRVRRAAGVLVVCADNSWALQHLPSTGAR